MSVSSIYNIGAAKTHFYNLVEEAESGTAVIIARAGKPILKLVRIEPELATPRVLGFAADRWIVPSWEEFDAADDEIAGMFNWDKF